LQVLVAALNGKKIRFLIKIISLLRGFGMRVWIFSVIASAIFFSTTSIAGEKIVATFPSRAVALSTLVPLSEIKQDKFESSTVCSALEKTTNLKPGATVYFTVFDVTVQYYDPDKKEFKFDVFEEFPNLFNSSLDKYIGVPLAKIVKDKKSYIGQNAYGVKVEVTATSEDIVALILPIKKAMNGSSIKAKLPMSPSEAKILENDLQLVVMTKIMPPCFVDGQHTSFAKLDFPQETNARLFGLVGSRDSNWKIIKKSNGEVLKTGHF
jgi:hypothetical protein